jgi:hypothetical protein
VPCTETTSYNGYPGLVEVRLTLLAGGQNVQVTWEGQPVTFGNLADNDCLTAAGRTI